MDLETLGISVLWIFLFGYVMVAAIDFGAGFFSAYSEVAKKKHILNKLIQRYLSPVWEVTNVFLVFFYIGIIGFFPKTAHYYGSILLVPVSISIVLLAIRGSYYAFGTYGSKNKKIYTLIYGITGLLIPASLSIVFTISEGGFVQRTDAGLNLMYRDLFVSPLTWSITLLSIVSILYISAVFLTYYANEAGDKKARDLLRQYALVWSMPTILAAVNVIFQLRYHNAEHYNHIIHLWWAFGLSTVFFGISLRLLMKRCCYGWAFISLALQFALAFFAYGFSHYPYLLYPYLTLYDGFTNTTMAISLVIAFIAGLFLLVPSLYLLLKLVLFNKKYVKGQI